MIVRPRSGDTEILQFQRAEYSPHEARATFESMHAALPIGTPAACATGALALVYWFRTENLKLTVTDDPSSTGWFAADIDGGLVFDFAAPIDAGAEDEPRNSPARTSTAALLGGVFDLIIALQPTAYRYLIDEVISVERLTESEFLEQKRASDYLYQRGVFGRL